MIKAKKLLMTLVVAVPCWASYAQGTVSFSNHSNPGGGVNAPVYQADGVTRLSDSQFMAELLEGPTASNLTTVASTGFLTGNAAGYFDGGTITLPGVSVTATVWVQVDVWNTASGASFVQAQSSNLPNSWWQSSLFTVVTGGGAVNPFPPAALTGLGTSPVFLNGAVPEPSLLALWMLAGIVGTIHFCGRRRRRKRARLKLILFSEKAPLVVLYMAVSLARAHAQGTVYFSNQYIQHGVNAPVYEADGITPLAGSQFMAALVGGPSSNALAIVATTGFLTQGYFIDGDQQINTVAPHNTAWVQVDVWNTAFGATFADAQASGLPNSWWQSSVFTVVTGGGGVNPFPAAPLTGLGTSPVFLNGAVPEPSPVALCMLAGVVATIRAWGFGRKI